MGFQKCLTTKPTEKPLLQKDYSRDYVHRFAYCQESGDGQN